MKTMKTMKTMNKHITLAALVIAALALSGTAQAEVTPGLNDPHLFFGGANYGRYEDSVLRAVIYGTDPNTLPTITAAQATFGVDDATKDVSTTKNITAQTTASVNTIRMTGATITMTAANTLSVNGILYVIPGTTSKAVGPNTTFLQPTAAGGELVLACFNPTSYGALQIEAVVQNNTSASSVTKEGTGIVTLKAISGGNTYSGVTKINTGTLKLVSSTSTNNIANSPLIDLAAGATLEISGMTHANQFVLASGQTLKGSGTVDGFNLNPNNLNPLANMTVGNGSTLSPGNSTGTLTVANAKETWAGGGTYAWQLLNTTGEAGTDWDLTAVTGTNGTVASNLAVTATADSKFNIALQTLSSIAPDVQGTAGGWTASDSHSWKIASSAGAITGWDVADDAASDLFAIDATNFVGAGTGSSFNVSKTGNDVFLNYVPSSGPIVVLGDTNEDGVVDAVDYIAIKTNFGLSGTGITRFQGDLIDNDIVDWADLQELMDQFGTRSVDEAPAAPEPATLGLLAIGALAVIRRRRRT
jgi:hypothetical protein